MPVVLNINRMFEDRRSKPISRQEFALRVLRQSGFGLGVILLALGVGVLGYHGYAHLSWVDSLLNASMILGGMGPVDPLPNDAAKVFASMYALFSGLAFIGLAGVMLAPFVHRLIHKFHWESD
jgi:hypothetical protein